MNRDDYIAKVSERLGTRKLVWIGTRGHDAQALMDIPQFSQVFSVAAPLGSLSIKTDMCLESLSLRRENLDTYTLDDDTSDAALEVRRSLYEALGTPTALAAYRSLNLISAVCYPRARFVKYLGMFHERQWPFEHKPWVENELRQAEVRVLPWTYYTDDHQQRLREELECRGTMVLRANRSDGGTGLRIVSRSADLEAQLPKHRDGFIGAAPLLLPHIPLNVNACVFPGGHITLHAPSFQLIGLEGCTSKPFGYCGNDFAAIRHLDDRVLMAFDDLVRRTGCWLASQGYVGAFGVDAMVHEGMVYLVEVNPRFQGSSMLAARIDRRMGRPDLFLCHLAAFLGLEPPDVAEGIPELATNQPELAHIICHNVHDRAVRFHRSSPDQASMFEFELVPDDRVAIQPEAILFRAVTRGPVTPDGWRLDASCAQELARATEGLESISPSAVNDPRAGLRHTGGEGTGTGARTSST